MHLRHLVVLFCIALEFRLQKYPDDALMHELWISFAVSLVLYFTKFPSDSGSSVWEWSWSWWYRENFHDCLFLWTLHSSVKHRILPEWQSSSYLSQILQGDSWLLLRCDYRIEVDPVLFQWRKALFQRRWIVSRRSIAGKWVCLFLLVRGYCCCFSKEGSGGGKGLGCLQLPVQKMTLMLFQQKIHPENLLTLEEWIIMRLEKVFR